MRWEPAAGALDHFFDDELVPATKACSRSCCARSSRSRPTRCVPYDPGYVSGWVVEQYQIDLVAAAEHAAPGDGRQAARAVLGAGPGDTQRNLQVDADYSDQTFKHMLVPIWLVAYDYGSAVYQVVVNGYTGRIAGNHPYSWVKIALCGARRRCSPSSSSRR